MSNNVAKGPVAYFCCTIAMALGAGNHSPECRNYRRCEHTELGERVVMSQEPVEIVTYAEGRCPLITDIGESLCPKHKLFDAMYKIACTATSPAAASSNVNDAVEAARNTEKSLAREKGESQ